MDNQHKQIRGYRDLTKDEIGVMNALKDKEADIIDALQDFQIKLQLDLDPRWLALGKTHLETAFMYLVKAVAKPESPYRSNS
jgi:hypothetical protein